MPHTETMFMRFFHRISNCPPCVCVCMCVSCNHSPAYLNNIKPSPCSSVSVCVVLFQCCVVLPWFIFQTLLNLFLSTKEIITFIFSSSWRIPLYQPFYFCICHALSQTYPACTCSGYSLCVRAKKKKNSYYEHHCDTGLSSGTLSIVSIVTSYLWAIHWAQSSLKSDTLEVEILS